MIINVSVESMYRTAVYLPYWLYTTFLPKRSDLDGFETLLGFEADIFTSALL